MNTTSIILHIASFFQALAAYASQQVDPFEIGSPSYEYEEELLHTLPEHPFCQDMTCPCHDDQELITEYLAEPWQAGHLTNAEADRIFHGQQIR